MPITTAMRYHLTPVRKVLINTSTNSKCWGECGEKGTHVHCWWGCILVQPLWKTVWHLPCKLKMELPHDPAILLLSIYLKKPKTVIRKNACAHMFTSATFTIASTWNQLKCQSIGEWIERLWHMYTMEYYLAIKRMKSYHFRQHGWT